MCSAASFTSSAVAERADTEALSSRQPTASSRHVSTVAGVASAVKSHLTFLLLIGGQKVGHSTYYSVQLEKISDDACYSEL